MLTYAKCKLKKGGDVLFCFKKIKNRELCFGCVKKLKIPPEIIFPLSFTNEKKNLD